MPMIGPHHRGNVIPHASLALCLSLPVWQLGQIDYGTETKLWLSVVKFSQRYLGQTATESTFHILLSFCEKGQKKTNRISRPNSIIKSIFCPPSLHSQRGQEPGAHGPQRPVRPLRQAQTDPRSQEWEQAEDQDHQVLPESGLEWKLHLVRHLVSHVTSSEIKFPCSHRLLSLKTSGVRVCN